MTKVVEYSVEAGLVPLLNGLSQRLTYDIPDRNNDTRSRYMNVLGSIPELGVLMTELRWYPRTDVKSKHIPAMTSRHAVMAKVQHVPMTSSVMTERL